jgi:hypothetical protein
LLISAGNTAASAEPVESLQKGVVIHGERISGTYFAEWLVARKLRSHVRVVLNETANLRTFAPFYYILWKFLRPFQEGGGRDAEIATEMPAKMRLIAKSTIQGDFIQAIRLSALH